MDFKSPALNKLNELSSQITNIQDDLILLAHQHRLSGKVSGELKETIRVKFSTIKLNMNEVDTLLTNDESIRYESIINDYHGIVDWLEERVPQD